jgi:hypothetical protein
MAAEGPASAQRRFMNETAESLRRIAERLPAELAQEILRVAQEIEDNAAEYKDAG